MIHKAGQKLVYPKEYAVVQQASAAIPWWNGGYAAYDAKNAVSYAASLLDLTGNGRHATTGVQPGHTPGVGWIFNGSGHYIRSAFTPADTNTTTIIKISVVTATDNFRCAYGMANTSGLGAVLLFQQQNTGLRTFYNGQTTSTRNLAGVHAYGTYAIAGKEAFVNGASIGSISAGAFNVAPLVCFIGCGNVNGSPAQYFGGTITSIGFWSSVLLLAQIASIGAAMP